MRGSLGASESVLSDEESPDTTKTLSDERFWRELRSAVYDGHVDVEDLKRFEVFCERIQIDASVPGLSPGGTQVETIPETGQIVSSGWFPGLRAKAAWIGDDSSDDDDLRSGYEPWLTRLRFEAPRIADELAEVLFEKAKVRASGGAWRNGFFYGSRARRGVEASRPVRRTSPFKRYAQEVFERSVREHSFLRGHEEL